MRQVFSLTNQGRSLSCLIHNAATLQDTLLVAGMHYIMRTRDIKTFDSTFLFHKIEIIQQINEMLTNQHIERSIDLTSRIVTMCLVEVCYISLDFWLTLLK